jgi:hypothetical protein
MLSSGLRAAQVITWAPDEVEGLTR